MPAMNKAMVNQSARWQNRGLFRDTLHLSIGQGFRLIIQAAYFVLVARALGPGAYGAFVTMVAISALLGPFSGMGTPNLFIKNVRSQKRPANVCWGNGILLTLVSGTLLSLLATLLSRLLQLKTAAPVVLTICLADMVLLKVTELAASGFTASGHMKQTSIQNVVASLLRLSGICGLMAAMRLAMRPVTLENWAKVYLFTTLLGTVYAVTRGSRLWGRPRTDLAALRKDVAEGVYFSIAGAATTIYNDIDKIMLSKLADLASTGVYAAAYRVIDVSMTPIRSLAAAAYPRFFERGVKGIAASYQYAQSLIAKTAVYGAVVSAALWILAPILVTILGPKYEAVVPAVRWLALIPFLRCFHSFLADALSGAGLQSKRMAIQVLVAAANIAANLVILPKYSWRGAAWTSLACDGLLVAVFWFANFFYCRQPK
jgi:O-antigen/teichoic acid export membrane protein